MHSLPLRSILVLLVMLITLLVPAQATRADEGSFLIDKGAYYPQASTQAGFGYTITDDGVDNYNQTIKFWSEFQRLGGVAVLGYPSSQRFIWDGFVCQATQRVVMQWRPETRTVSFINVFDLASAADMDSYLEAVRQTPKPAQFNDLGKPFQQVVTERLMLLNSRPALRAAYYNQGTAAVELNGVPVAPISDMGDAYVLRAQRIVFQEWKKDMPWARAGQVTIANGGDIAKELGLIQAQSPNAVNPVPRPAPISGVTAVQVTSDVRIQPAVENLLRYDREFQTRYMETMVRGGVKIIFAELPDGVLGSWSPRTYTLRIADWIAPLGTPAILGVLSHESSHAHSTITGVRIRTTQDCYDEEIRAFKHQVNVWEWLYPQGKPVPQNSVEREMNNLLYQIRNNEEGWTVRLYRVYEGQCGAR